MYPIPGSRADEILNYIRANPGCTKNSIITALKLNPGPTKKTCERLAEKQRVEDVLDEQGQHHYTARAIL